jgi:hypothetical protein
VGPSLLPSPLCGTCVTALSPNQICLSQKESSRQGGADSASSCYAKVFEQKKNVSLAFHATSLSNSELLTVLTAYLLAFSLHFFGLIEFA